MLGGNYGSEGIDPTLNGNWCCNQDVESVFLDYAKYPQYSAGRFVSWLSEKQEESQPYRYVRTFAVEPKSRPVAEMDKDEIQEFINQLLGAKGTATKTREITSN